MVFGGGTLPFNRSKSRFGQGTLKKRTLPKESPKASNLFLSAELWVTAANSASMGLIFAFRQFLPIFFREVARFLLTPFNAACNLTRAALAFFDAHREGYKAAALLRFAVALISGVAIATAIAGAIFAATAFALIGPVLSIIGFSLRALYHGAISIYHTIEALSTSDPLEAEKHWDKVISNGISTIQSILNVVAIAMVLIAMVSSFGIMGIVAGVLGASFQIYRALQVGNQPPVEELIEDPAVIEALEAEASQRNSPAPTPNIHRELQQFVTKPLDNTIKKISPPSPTRSAISSSVYGSQSHLSVLSSANTPDPIPRPSSAFNILNKHDEDDLNPPSLHRSLTTGPDSL